MSAEAKEGLSPRGRGKLPRIHHHRQQGRSIPAWAGETFPRGMTGYTKRVYPRVGGGNLSTLSWTSDSAGLSPRGRGKRSACRRPPRRQRSIPAWAGETIGADAIFVATEVYPRVGGGNAYRMPIISPEQGLSPRGRGKQGARKRWAGRIGSIPAWAGETRAAQITADPEGVQGLSPRGRGKPDEVSDSVVRARSIPAWAGETPRQAASVLTLTVYPRVGGGNMPAQT